jgi:hypothetical protein
MILRLFLVVAVALAAGAGKPERESRSGGRKGTLSEHAMATIYWTGAANDGNWNTVTNWSGGALPVNDDVVYVSSHAQSGMWLNLDRTGDTAGAGLDLNLFEIEEGFAFDIGTSNTYLQMAADEVMDRGSGNVFYKSDDGTSSIDTDLVTVRKPDANGTFYLTDEGSSGSSNVAQLRVVGGRCSFSGGLTLPLVYLTPLAEFDSFTALETQTSSGITSAYQAGGVCRFRSNAPLVDTYHMSGGELILGAEEANLALATLIHSGGRVSIAPGCNYVQVSNYTGVGGYFDGTTPTSYQSIITLRAGPQFAYELGPNMSGTIIILGD